MPIQLDFSKDPSLNRYGEVPVYLQIDSVVLLDWLPLHLPSFAAWGFSCLQMTFKHPRACMELEGYGHYLLLAQAQDSFLIACSYTQTEVTVNHTSLMRAWFQFATEVKQFRTACFEGADPFGWWFLLEAYPPPNLEEHLLRFSDIGVHEEFAFLKSETKQAIFA